MNLDQARMAAELLWRTWLDEGLIAAIPESCRPATRSDGYRIQAQVAEVSGQPTVGWKIAATSSAGQAHLKVDGPLAGRLLADRVHPNGSAVVFGDNHMRVAEAEFAFRLGTDLPPRSKPYEQAEVLAAVESLHPAIEIPDSRYADFCVVGSPQLIADNACAHHFVLGPPTTADWRQIDLKSHVVQLELDGTHNRDGIGSNVLGDPRLALTWIANELSQHGIGMRAGHVITTGTCIVPVAIQRGSRLVANFGAIGTVRTELV